MVTVFVMASLASGVSLVPVAGEETDDWPTFSHDNRNSGYNPNTTGPVSNITERWNFTADDRVRSSPAVVNGTVYVGSDDNYLYALNASDGTQRWRFETGSDVLSSPAVVDGTVYVGSTDFNVYALNATDGTKRWNFTADGGTTSSPAVVDDTVYILGSKIVYALNRTDGTEQWNFSIGLGQRMSPAVANDTVYFGDADGTVFALNATDGTKRWDFDTGDGVRSAPAVVDDTVYVGNKAGAVLALNATDGTKRWNFTTGNEVFASPAVANGVVYVGSFDRDVYALNASDGAKRWNFTTGSIVVSSAAVVNDTVYVGSNDNNVYALNAKDGSERWNFTTGFQVVSSPAVLDGVVYVGSSDNKVYALEEASPDGTSPPQLIESTPADDETDVTSDTEVTLVFDQAVQAGSGRLFLNSTADDTVLDSVAIGSTAVTFDGTNVTWTRNGDLPSGTDVYLYVSDGVILDAEGTAWPGIRDATVLNFATGTGDWPTFSYDNRNSGHNPHAVAPVSNVTELWNTSIGIDVESSPVVVDGTLFVGSTDDNVYALNASDGSVRWKFSADQNIDSSPAVVDNTVYIGSWDKRLYAINASDGTERWNFTTSFVVRSSPKVVDDTVYIGTMSASSIDGRIYALNVTDGTERWHFDTGSDILTTPAVVNGSVYFGSFRLNRIYALDATDGTKRWESTLGGNVRSSPAVVDGVVYVGAFDGKVYALDATDGSERWNFTTDGGIENSPAVGNDTVYVGSSDDKLYALNATDGSERWHFNAEIDVDSAPALANGVVYFGTADHTIYAMDAATGAHQWNFTTSDIIRSSPAIVDGVVYVSTESAVHALGGELPTDVADSDTTNPKISNFSVQVVDTRTITVSFDSNESLDTIEVEVENQAGTVAETLSSADFGSVGTDPIAYVAETTLNSADTYTITLTTAADAAGNGGAAGQNATVQLVVEDVSVEHVNGTAPDMANLTSNVYLTQGSGGLLQVQLRDASDPNADLVNRTGVENLGLAPNTTLTINVTVVDWTPRVLLGTGHNLTWSTTDVGANVTTLNLTVQPAETQLIESQLLDPGQPWPTGASDRADIRMNATVDLAVDDMGFIADPAQRNLFNGTILATDAQAFGTSQYDATTNALSLFVAGPHLSVDGENNTGFYDAFLSDALLDEWQVTDPAELTVTALGEDVAPATAVTVPGGIRLFVPIHYSKGSVEVSVDTTPPTAVAAADTTSPSTGDTVTFDGTGSADASGIASYAWDFDGDGTTDATGPTPSHSFSSAGSFVVELTVTDGAGNSAVDTVTIDVASSTSVGSSTSTTAATPVSAPAEPAFVFDNLTLTPDRLTVGEPVTVTANVSNDGDADGTLEIELTTHEGQQVAQTEVSLAAGETTAITLTTSFDEPGEYGLALNGESIGSISVHAAASPTPTPTATAIETPSPSPTTTATSTVSTASPTGTAAVQETTQDSPSPTPTPSTPVPTETPGQPGFGFLVALPVVLTLAYITRRRRR